MSMSKLRKPAPADAHKTIPVGDPHKTIHVRGAREHNLKHIDVRIPRNKLVVSPAARG